MVLALTLDIMVKKIFWTKEATIYICRAPAAHNNSQISLFGGPGEGKCPNSMKFIREKRLEDWSKEFTPCSAKIKMIIII